MSRNNLLIHALLWAVAIVASAIVSAPAFLSIVLLPVLAATALLIGRQRLETARHPDRCAAHPRGLA